MFKDVRHVLVSLRLKSTYQGMEALVSQPLKPPFLLPSVVSIGPLFQPHWDFIVLQLECLCSGYCLAEILFPTLFSTSKGQLLVILLKPPCCLKSK